MKNVTRKDIAEKLGVSVSVVSRVINNSGYVSKEKREKVLKAAKEMGYVQNPVAMALQQNKTKQLLFFCEDLTATYYNQMYHGMVRAARERGYHVSTVMDENDFEMVKETMTDGIFIPLVSLLLFTRSCTSIMYFSYPVPISCFILLFF